MDIKTDLKTKDLILENGDLVLTKQDSHEIAQRVGLRLGTHFGEWFLDISAGVPYFQRFLKTKQTELELVRFLTNYITDTEGVVAVTNVQWDFNKALRTYKFSCSIIAEDETLPEIPFTFNSGGS